MQEFYLAPRGSFREVTFLAENWDLFLSLRKELGLPRLGLLLVPTQRKEAKAVSEYGVPIAMDNGAFQLLKIDFDLQLYLAQHVVRKWLREWLESALALDWDWFALLDVPVHGKKFVEEEERLRRIELTAKLHALAFSEFEKQNGETVRLRAVLQGYTVEEYLLSWRMEQAVIPFRRINPVLAVGSVCVRKNSSLTKLADGKARGTSEELAELLNQVPQPLHFFGLHGRFVRKLRDHPRFFSSDSGAGGAVFRWEIRDIKRKLSRGDSYCQAVIGKHGRLGDYLLAHLVQYIRSTTGLNKKGWEALRSLAC